MKKGHSNPAGEKFCIKTGCQTTGRSNKNIPLTTCVNGIFCSAKYLNQVVEAAGQLPSIV